MEESGQLHSPIPSSSGRKILHYPPITGHVDPRAGPNVLKNMKISFSLGESNYGSPVVLDNILTNENDEQFKKKNITQT
jgi:hypothetical protein